MAVYTVIKGATAVQTIAKAAFPNLPCQPFSQNTPNSPAASHSLQIVVRGAVPSTATVQFVGSNDGVNWINYGATVAATMNQSDGSPGTNAIAGSTAFTFISAFVTAISGAGASVDAIVSA